MKELYLATCDGTLHLSVPETWPEELIPFIESLRNNDFLNFEADWPVGDPELVMAVTYFFPDSPFGCVVVFIKEEPQYALLATSKLALTAAASYAAQTVADLRYGNDIYQDKAEE